MTEAVVTINGRVLSVAQVTEVRRLIERVFYVVDPGTGALSLGALSDVLALLEPPPALPEDVTAGLVGRLLTRQQDADLVAAVMEMPDQSLYAVVQREGDDPAGAAMVVDVRVPREALFLLLCVLSYANHKLGRGDAPPGR